jgi:ML domain
MKGPVFLLLGALIGVASAASVTDLCSGKCDFVPKGEPSLVPAPTPGSATKMTILGEFKEEFTGGSYICKNYYSMFIWISAGDSEGDPCGEGAFACPVQVGDREESITMEVPADAPAGKYKSECKFTTADGKTFADLRINFSIK